MLCPCEKRDVWKSNDPELDQMIQVQGTGSWDQTSGFGVPRYTITFSVVHKADLKISGPWSFCRKGWCKGKCLETWWALVEGVRIEQ